MDPDRGRRGARLPGRRAAGVPDAPPLILQRRTPALHSATPPEPTAGNRAVSTALPTAHDLHRVVSYATRRRGRIPDVADAGRQLRGGRAAARADPQSPRERGEAPAAPAHPLGTPERAAADRPEEDDADLEPAVHGPGSAVALGPDEGGCAERAGRSRRPRPPERRRAPPVPRPVRARAAVDDGSRERRRHPPRAARGAGGRDRGAGAYDLRYPVWRGGRATDAPLPPPRRPRRGAARTVEAARGGGPLAERCALSRPAARSRIRRRAPHGAARGRRADSPRAARGLMPMASTRPAR